MSEDPFMVQLSRCISSPPPSPPPVLSLYRSLSGQKDQIFKASPGFLCQVVLLLLFSFRFTVSEQKCDLF